MYYMRHIVAKHLKSSLYVVNYQQRLLIILAPLLPTKTYTTLPPKFENTPF